MVAAQADRLEVGRDNFLNVADKVYDSINGTLDNSFQFVFGRFKEQVAGSPLPKTLEDARKLVSSPTAAEQEDEILTNSGHSSPALEDPLSTGSNNKVLELIGGRNQLRDRSVDSTRSGGSGKRVAFSEVAKEKPKDEQPIIPAANLFNAINPLNRFAVPGFARFGRSSSITTTTNGGQPAPPSDHAPKLGNIVESPITPAGQEPLPSLERQRTKDSTISTPEDDLNALEALANLRKIKPPKKRFLEVPAAELKIGEVEELLREYRRLAKAIGEAVAT